MRVTQRRWLWARSGLLCLALLLGLVLMHHAPHAGGHQQGHGTVAAVVGDRLLDDPHAAERHSGQCPCVATPPSPPESPLSGATSLLHLCLAVLAAAMLFTALRQVGPARSPAAPGPVRAALGHLQPRPPVPRVLASLGVLRL